MRIPITYYKEIGPDTLVSAVMDNSPLINVGGQLYQLERLDNESTRDHPDVTEEVS